MRRLKFWVVEYSRLEVLRKREDTWVVSLVDSDLADGRIFSHQLTNGVTNPDSNAAERTPDTRMKEPFVKKNLINDERNQRKLESRREIIIRSFDFVWRRPPLD